MRAYGVRCFTVDIVVLRLYVKGPLPLVRRFGLVVWVVPFAWDGGISLDALLRPGIRRRLRWPGIVGVVWWFVLGNHTGLDGAV